MNLHFIVFCLGIVFKSLWLKKFSSFDKTMTYCEFLFFKTKGCIVHVLQTYQLLSFSYCLQSQLWFGERNIQWLEDNWRYHYWSMHKALILNIFTWILLNYHFIDCDWKIHLHATVYINKIWVHICNKLILLRQKVPGWFKAC